MGRGMNNRNIVLNSFYCIKCGNKSYDLPRDKGRKHKKFHKKKLYCPYCRIEVNHIECRNDAEIFEFKEKFENGEYEDEETLFTLRSFWSREDNLCQTANC